MQNSTYILRTDSKNSAIGAVANRGAFMAFTPFGFARQHAPHRSLFNGELCDPLTRRYLLGNGYRAYSPVLGRFLSPDSFSPFGQGGINSYAYCSGDPINASDPSGHIKTSAQIKVKNSVLIDLAVPYKDTQLIEAIKQSLGNNTKLGKLLFERGEETANSVYANSRRKIDYISTNTDPVGAAASQFEARTRDVILANALATTLDKPAGLTLSDIAMNAVPHIDPSIGMNALMDMFELPYKLPRAAHLRMRQLLQKHARDTPTTLGYPGWLKESKELNDLLRKKT
jgi:RHS repeat-associated protein